MQLPFFAQAPSFDVLPSYRLSRFYDEPEPALSFFQGYFTKEGLHIQLRAYEKPTEHSYFCFTLLSGKKLRFSRNLYPHQPDLSLQAIPEAGENLMGHYWGSQLFIPYVLCPEPISGIVGLFHSNIPQCFLSEDEYDKTIYPLIHFIPEPHPKSSSKENQ